jgi:pyruvate/2-oxoglutarate dehydrogenase complex dihydrolipoamide acyltransferase (E2) component
MVMPFLSETMEEGTVVKWLKSVGDAVALGEALAEIDTDKVTVVYDSDTAGVLSEILVAEGETVPPGQVIARITPS